MTANSKFVRDGQGVKGWRNDFSMQSGRRRKDVQECFKGDMPVSQKHKNRNCNRRLLNEKARRAGAASARYNWVA